MRVEIVRDSAAAGIDLDRHVFASTQYLSAKSSDYGWVKGGGCAIPFFVDHIAGFRRLIFTDAPIVRSDDSVQAFLDGAVLALQNARICDFIAKPQANAVFTHAPRTGVSAPWGTYEVRIDRTDEELMRGFHEKHRNVIRKASRDGIEIRRLEDFSIVQTCLRDTLQRQGLPYFPSLPLLQTLAHNLKGNITSLGAYLGENLQGVAFAPHDREKGYYLYGGSSDHPHSGSLNLLQFGVMQDLRSRGVGVYDFFGARIGVKQGTKYEGIQRFKSRFGASLRQGFTFRVVFNPIRYSLFNRLADLRLRLNGRRYVDPIDQVIGNDYE